MLIPCPPPAIYHRNNGTKNLGVMHSEACTGENVVFPIDFPFDPLSFTLGHKKMPVAGNLFTSLLIDGQPAPISTMPHYLGGRSSFGKKLPYNK